jgi:leader peptidase (prepilin peptidase)/N-methyltransferase
VPVVSWLALRGRCAGCDEAIPVRYPLVELATAVLFVGVAGWVLSGPTPPSTEAWPVLVAFLYLAAISIALTLIDLDTHRLPNGIVLPAYVVAGALLTVASALASDWGSLVRAGIGMLVLYVFYAGLRLVRPGGMGGGDVKLAGVLGIYLGWLGWPSLIVGAFGAFLLGGVFGVALLASRRATRRTAIPFGPWMLAGAWLGILAGPALGDWYLGMLHG